MKIYTKKGDKGMTSLYDCSKLNKSSIIFDVMGEIDELSVRVGMLISSINLGPKILTLNLTELKIVSKLRDIQINMQDINSILATPNQNKRDKKLKNVSIDESVVKGIEELIDKMEKYIPRLTYFILPCVTREDSLSHSCRTQTRKCERMLWKLVNNDDHLSYIDDAIFKYMNRLSDFFFVLARYICFKTNNKEVKK